MRRGQASRTAEYNALFRAIENRAAKPRLRDATAAQLLSPPLTWVAALARLGPVHAGLEWFIDRRWPGVRASVIARSVVIDQRVDRALRSGIAQLVILGAGLDTRVRRLVRLEGVSAFEVDHPDTQRSKLARLTRATESTMRAVTYIPVDFNVDSLDEALAAGGFDDAAPSVVVWEGVSNYLDARSVEPVLRWCSRRGAGSEVLFTYVHRDVLDAPHRFVGTARLARSLARAGEPLTYGTTPDGLRAFVEPLGLRVIDDQGAADYRARVYGEASAAIRGHEFYRLAHMVLEAHAIGKGRLVPAPSTAPSTAGWTPASR